MHPSFWHERWQDGRIGFHRTAYNPRLTRWWPELDVTGRVLVPLCGKTLDLRWLAEQGHEVIGVELSSVACEAYFAELGVRPERDAPLGVQRYRHGRVSILCGDFFEIPDELLQAEAAYDRAASVALPPDLRTAYARRLGEVVTRQMLLVAFVYPQAEREGPPFAIPAEEVSRLYGDAFTLSSLARHDLRAEAPPEERFATSSFEEHVWRLTRR